MAHSIGRQRLAGPYFTFAAALKAAICRARLPPNRQMPCPRLRPGASIAFARPADPARAGVMPFFSVKLTGTDLP
jgi:hypothetical protein